MAGALSPQQIAFRDAYTSINKIGGLPGLVSGEYGPAYLTKVWRPPSQPNKIKARVVSAVHDGARELILQVDHSGSVTIIGPTHGSGWPIPTTRGADFVTPGELPMNLSAGGPLSQGSESPDKMPDGSGDGTGELDDLTAGGVGQWVKDHPLITAAVLAGIAKWRGWW